MTSAQNCWPKLQYHRDVALLTNDGTLWCKTTDVYLSRTVISAHGVNDDNSVHYVKHTSYHHSHNNIWQGKKTGRRNKLELLLSQKCISKNWHNSWGKNKIELRLNLIRQGWSDQYWACHNVYVLEYNYTPKRFNRGLPKRNTFVYI